VPRISAAHEQEVRDRILDAAMRVFSEKGYHASTIADVVRESGLSVGAIYTHFSGKDELIRLTCDQIAARGLDDLADRLAPANSQ
jgi:AcrR family transcriptional regulator